LDAFALRTIILVAYSTAASSLESRMWHVLFHVPHCMDKELVSNFKRTVNI